MKCVNSPRNILAALAFLALPLIAFPQTTSSNPAKEGGANVSGTAKQHLMEAYGKLPLSFEANAGQASDEVEFLSRGGGYVLFLTKGAEATLVLKDSVGKERRAKPTDALKSKFKAPPESRTTVVLKMKLVGGAVNPEAAGLQQLPGNVNYFLGNDPQKWRTNVPTYARVNFHEVYPGVDLAYYGNHRQLEYDFIVAPQADPDSITIAIEGATLSLDAQGNLVLTNADKKIVFQKPVVYQDVDGVRQEIPSSYLLKGADQFGFQLGAYDRSRPLIIDPTLSYSTFIGSGTNYSIAVDADGNAYVTGQAGVNPTTPGAFQTVRPSPYGSGFVTKLNPTGTALIYSTYLGGTSDTDAYAIAVDAAGNAYVVGRAGPGFPTTLGAFQPVRRSIYGYNAFVAKLNSSGSALAYSSYLGGSSFDNAKGIAVDAAGNAYLTGFTNSFDFPVTLGAFQPIYRGTAQSENAFVTEVNADGTALLYSTFLGGSNWDQASGIAVDAQANAYVTGAACSSDFPVTPFAFQTSYRGSPNAAGPGGGACNAFVSKMNPALPGPLSLIYSTYLGGSGGDDASGIAVDTQNNAYVAGESCSLDFPVSPLAFQSVSHAACDAFVTKLNPAGSGLVYSTYLGGSSGDGANAIAVDAGGNAYVTGITNSADFPVTPDAFVATNGGPYDAFLTVLNPSGSAPLVYSTYLGGSCSHAYQNSCDSNGPSIFVDNTGNAYLTGWTYANNFPTTPGAFQTNTSPYGNGFVAKFSGFPTAQ
jgi:Beta-propeller repeat